MIKGFDIFCDIAARQDAHGLRQAEGKTARKPRDALIFLHRQHRLKQGRNFAINKMLQAPLHFLDNLRASILINKGLSHGACCVTAKGEFANRRLAPHQPTLLGEVKFRVGRIIQTICAQMQLGLEGSHGGLAQSFRLIRGGGTILAEAEPVQTTNELALYGDFPVFIHFGHKALLLFQSPHQNRCAPIDKSLGQSLMERI